MRARGITLMWVLPLTATLFALGIAIVSQVEGLRQAQIRHAQGMEARSMALSGLDYGKSLLRHRRWSGSRIFRSPLFASGGSFLLEVRPVGTGYTIRSEGRCGRQSWVESGRFP